MTTSITYKRAVPFIVYLSNQGQVTQPHNVPPYGMVWTSPNSPQTYDAGHFCHNSFNGKERDYESGFLYYEARYYWSELLTSWLSVDPLADKYPGISPYAYCSWNPVKLVDPDGESPIFPLLLFAKASARVAETHFSNSDIKSMAYAVNHPVIALRVGKAKDGGMNGISSYASNFSINMSRAANLSKEGEGSQRNAIRHTLWQAMITNMFGEKQAKRIGNAHEDGSVANFLQKKYDRLSDADKAVDLLNNEIGRLIGIQNRGKNNASIAQEVAKEFYKNGLWTTYENQDGSYSIHKTRINRSQYLKIFIEIQKLNNYGLNE